MQPFSAGPDAWALAEHFKTSFKRQLHLIIAKNPKYLWGGSEDLERGLDCSGYVYLAARWAAIPGICRTTSLRMSQGFGGWIGKDLAIDQAEECDLLFWTFNTKRPEGHVGVLLLDEFGRRKATHASTRRGAILDPLDAQLTEPLTKVRRLTIGE